VIQRIGERHRRPARSRTIAYDRPGWFFVTIVTRGRWPFFGEIAGGVERLNAGGIAVEQCWLALPERFPAIRLDEFVLMPNHLHGIVVIEPARADQTAPSLSAVVGAFKSLSTRAWSRGVIEEGWEPFEGRLWQRSYHDRLLRSPEELELARAYIVANPSAWPADDEHPANARRDTSD
jgi:REP element-mobilizing transposase RayT